MTRTDIHRPSSADFDPEAYACLGVFDNDAEWTGSTASVEAVRRLTDQGYSFGPGSSSQCGHCGANIRYCALMVREDVKEFIFVGETCLGNRFESLTKTEFQALRKAAALSREREVKSIRFTELCSQAPALVWATYAGQIDAEPAEAGWELNVMADIAAKARQYGHISPKQGDFLASLVEKITAKYEAAIEHAAASAVFTAAGVEAPEGKVTVTGTVLSTKVQSGFYGTEYKMLVAHADGWKVWSTIPSAIRTDTLDDLRGQAVQFIATLTRSTDDALFAFAKRPTQARMVV